VRLVPSDPQQPRARHPCFVWRCGSVSLDHAVLFLRKICSRIILRMFYEERGFTPIRWYRNGSGGAVIHHQSDHGHQFRDVDACLAGQGTTVFDMLPVVLWTGIVSRKKAR
jgi:hypothetical protein